MYLQIINNPTDKMRIRIDRLRSNNKIKSFWLSISLTHIISLPFAPLKMFSNKPELAKKKLKIHYLVLVYKT